MHKDNKKNLALLKSCLLFYLFLYFLVQIWKHDFKNVDLLNTGTQLELPDIKWLVLTSLKNSRLLTGEILADFASRY